MLYGILDHVLGTSSKVKLLRVLVPLRSPVSGRQAARLAGLAPKASVALEELAGLGVLNRQESTGQYLYSFNHANQLAGVLSALFQAEDERTVDILDALGQAVASCPEVISGAVFGSAARGEAGPGSDLDVLIVVANQRDVPGVLDALLDASPVMRDRFGIRLSPTVLPRSRWLEQIQDSTSFASLITADAKTFIGIPPKEISDAPPRQKTAL